MKWIRDEIYAGGGRFETKNIKKMKIRCLQLILLKHYKSKCDKKLCVSLSTKNWKKS